MKREGCRDKMNLPCCTRVIDEHVKSISLLLDLRYESLTAFLAAKIGDNVLALAGTELVEALGGLLQL